MCNKHTLRFGLRGTGSCMTEDAPANCHVYWAYRRLCRPTLAHQAPLTTSNLRDRARKAMIAESQGWILQPETGCPSAPPTPRVAPNGNSRPACLSRWVLTAERPPSLLYSLAIVYDRSLAFWQASYPWSCSYRPRQQWSIESVDAYQVQQMSHAAA